MAVWYFHSQTGVEAGFSIVVLKRSQCAAGNPVRIQLQQPPPPALTMVAVRAEQLVRDCQTYELLSEETAFLQLKDTGVSPPLTCTGQQRHG